MVPDKVVTMAAIFHIGEHPQKLTVSVAVPDLEVTACPHRKAIPASQTDNSTLIVIQITVEWCKAHLKLLVNSAITIVRAWNELWKVKLIICNSKITTTFIDTKSMNLLDRRKKFLFCCQMVKQSIASYLLLDNIRTVGKSRRDVI